MAKARAGAKLRRFQSAAIAFGAGVAFALGALVSLAAGMVGIFIPLVGPGFATLISVAIFALAAVGSFLLGKRLL